MAIVCLCIPQTTTNTTVCACVCVCVSVVPIVPSLTCKNSEEGPGVHGLHMLTLCHLQTEVLLPLAQYYSSRLGTLLLLLPSYVECRHYHHTYVQ